jgi:hypothetical protein
MNDKSLSQALLDLDARALAGAVDPREPLVKIMAGDRRRVFWWSAAAIVFWMLALLMVGWMLVAMGLLMPQEAMLRDPAQLAHAGLSPEQRADALLQVHIMSRMILVGVTFSVALLGIAAGATVFLVRASRHATLRQINASLLEISAQLQALRAGAASR